jgi:hypothetical protein
VTDAVGAPDGCETTGATVDVLPTSRLTAVGETETEVTEVGSGETVTAIVPGTPPTVAVIVTFPTATAVTRPVALTVATAGLELLHATVRPVSSAPVESRTVVASCWVLPGMSAAVPGVTCTLATAAATVTDTNSVSVAAAKLVLPGAVTVTVIVAVPGVTAVITPAVETLATPGSVVPYVSVAAGAPEGRTTTGVTVRV